MLEINYDLMSLNPYEYWDLRLRHFNLIQQDDSLPDEYYDLVKREVLLDLHIFLTKQEAYGGRRGVDAFNSTF